MKLVLLEKLFSPLGLVMMLDVWSGHLDTFAEKRRIVSRQILLIEFKRLQGTFWMNKSI